MNPFLDEPASEEAPSFSAWLGEWARSRQYWRLLAGLPALLILGAMLVLGGFVLGWRGAGAEAGIRSLAERAFRGQDFETARVAYQSLLRLGGKQSQQHAYQLMQTQFQLGHQHEALVLALQLAPPKRLGYAPAHLFVAKTILSKSNLPPAAVEEAASQLERVLQADPATTEARELLSQIYLSTGQRTQAKRQLLELVGSSGDAMLRLAVLLDAEGDANGKRYWAERAAKFFRGKVEPLRTDDARARLSWANALMLQEDYPAAFQLLEAAWKSTRNEVYQPALAQLCAEWSQWLARRQPGDLATRFRAVQQGLELDPANPVLVQQLASLTSLGGAEGESARGIVAGMMREGRNTGLLHFCLGGEAWAKGDQAKAFEHFRLAYEVAAGMPLVANNMALTLAWQEKPELDRALAIAESLVQQDPHNPAFRDTRGQVLVKLGRSREALADLAYALPLLEDKAPTHRALAECYRKLGLADLADGHETAARAAATNAPTVVR